jgi:hypothetical protein
MPELPEVETVARGLRQTILGRRILSVTLGKTDFIDDPSALEQNLPGRQIEAVERYGKFMLLLAVGGDWSSPRCHEWRRGASVTAGASGDDRPARARSRRAASRKAHTRLLGSR